MRTKINYNDQAEAYARNRRVHLGVLADLFDHGGLARHSRVLEVGCGIGNYVGAIHDQAGCSCWGIDPSTGMLDQARLRSPQVSFSQGEAGRLGFGSDFFDLIFSVDVIHHVPDPLAYFKEARFALKAGGRICTATDDEEIIRSREPLSRYFPSTVERELARYPSIAALKGAMRDSGFGQIEVRRVEHHYVVEDITAYQERSFSALRLISDRESEEGLARLRRDLEAGPVEAVSRYVMAWAVAP